MTTRPNEKSECAEPKNWKEWGALAWRRSLEWADTEHVIAIFTVILGIATCSLGAATWKLWRSTDRLVSGAQDTSERQLRAYVALKTIEWQFVGDKASHTIAYWKFIPKWENSGATPTRFLTNYISHQPMLGMLPANFDYPDIGDGIVGRVTITPKNIMHGNHIDISVKSLQLVKEKKANAFVWGWADYNDVFEKTPRRRSEFCVEIIVHGDSLAENCQFFFKVVDGPFNGLDTECYRQPKPYAE